MQIRGRRKGSECKYCKYSPSLSQAFEWARTYVYKFPLIPPKTCSIKESWAPSHAMAVCMENNKKVFKYLKFQLCCEILIFMCWISNIFLSPSKLLLFLLLFTSPTHSNNIESLYRSIFYFILYVCSKYVCLCFIHLTQLTHSHLSIPPRCENICVSFLRIFFAFLLSCNIRWSGNFHRFTEIFLLIFASFRGWKETSSWKENIQNSKENIQNSKVK